MPSLNDYRQRIVTFVQDRQTTLASGLAALLIIVVGFLIFNFFLNVNKETTTTDNETTQTEEATESAQVTETPTATPTSTATPTTTPTPTPTQSAGTVSPQGGASTTSETTYTIKSGDTLSKIAQSHYGDAAKWTLIADENKISDASKIHAGNTLTLPKADSTDVATIKETPRTGAGEDVEYVVSSGDTLWELAQEFYGSGFEWYRIKEANQDKIGTLNSGRPLITAGQHLIIP